MRSVANLMFLHGWGFGPTIWDHFTENYFLDCLVVKPSFMDLNTKSYDHCVDLLAKELTDQTIIVAWSMGGMFGIELACRYKEKIKALILLNTSPQFVATEDWHYGIEKTLMESLLDRLESDVKDALQYFCSLVALGDPRHRTLIRHLKTQMITQQLAPSPLIYWLQKLSQWDQRKNFSELKGIVQILLSDHDSLVPPEVKTALYELNPNIKVNTLAGCHASFLAAPKTVATMVRKVM